MKEGGDSAKINASKEGRMLYLKSKIQSISDQILFMQQHHCVKISQ